jgi:hypothetical protein
MRVDGEAMSIKIEIGSPAWVEEVFATPPVRQLKGRSKPTQFHQMWSVHLGRHIGAQGRNELNCALMLEHLCNLGLIIRFKEQPFRTSVQEFGAEIVPDYIAQGNRGELYVIEAKSARYITVEVAATHNRNRDAFRQKGITYLVWSDKNPFTKSVRHALLEMFRHRLAVIRTQIEELCEALEPLRAQTFEVLFKKNFDRSTIFAAAWNGDVFFDLKQEFGPYTKISLDPISNLKEIVLDARRAGGRWWDTLSSEEV